MEGSGKGKDGRDGNGVNAPQEGVAPRDDCRSGAVHILLPRWEPELRTPCSSVSGAEPSTGGIYRLANI